MEDKLNDLMNDGDYYSAHQLILSLTKRFNLFFGFLADIYLLEKSSWGRPKRQLNLSRMELRGYVLLISSLVPLMLQCQFSNMRNLQILLI